MPKPNPRSTPLSVAAAPQIAIEPVDDTPQTPAPFMHCTCLGALPGRGCMHCSGTKWMKRCHNCNGSGILFKNTRRGAEPRSERCGRCMGIGWTSAMPRDREEIAAYEATLEATPA